MAPTSKLSMGIKRASRSHAYHRRGLWAIKAKNGGAFPKAEKPAAAAEPKFYPADDVKPRVPSTRKPKPTKLRCRSHSFESQPAWCSCLLCVEI
jgi:large subunit ribosomal protein L6e